jgi:hypothetical protein
MTKDSTSSQKKCDSVIASPLLIDGLREGAKTVLRNPFQTTDNGTPVYFLW